MTIVFEHLGGTAEAGAPQPETVVALLRQLGVRDASGQQLADILRIWLHDNIPSPQLRISILRNGYGAVLGGRAGILSRLS